MSENQIQVEVKIVRGKTKILIRNQNENRATSKSSVTKSLTVDEWKELKRSAQAIDKQLLKSSTSRNTLQLPVLHSEPSNAKEKVDIIQSSFAAATPLVDVTNTCNDEQYSTANLQVIFLRSAQSRIVCQNEYFQNGASRQKQFWLL